MVERSRDQTNSHGERSRTADPIVTVSPARLPWGTFQHVEGGAAEPPTQRACRLTTLNQLSLKTAYPSQNIYQRKNYLLFDVLTGHWSLHHQSKEKISLFDNLTGHRLLITSLIKGKFYFSS